MTLVSNTLKLSLAFIITKILSLFWNIYLTRLFTDNLEELGIYIFVITQFSIFSIIAEGNISYAVQHFVSTGQLNKKEAINEYWSFSFVSKLITSLICSLALFLVIIIQAPDYFLSAVLISLNLFVYTIGTSPNALFICFNKFNPLVISNILNISIFTIFGVIFLTYFKDLNYALFAMLIGNFIHTVYMLFYGFNEFKGLDGLKKLPLQLNNILLKFCLPVAIFSFCSTLMYRVDFNIFEYLLSPDLIVYLGFATMCFFIMFDLIWGQLGVAITPELIRKWSSGNNLVKEKVISQFLSLFSLFTIISIFLIIGLKFFGIFFFTFLLGEDGDFFKIIPLLNNLIFSTPFFLGFSFLYRLYLVEYSTFKIMIYSLIFICIKLFLTLILPKDYVFAYSTLITSFILVLVCFSLMLMKSLKIYRKAILSSFFKSLLLIIILYIFSSNWVGFDFLKLNIVLSLLIITFGYFMFKRNLNSFFK